ncbi:hypothetical protein BCV71DRAFT_170085 [Rhizopus microsporus]|uniref:WDR59/RTC1-like RING zinc finger domain-containing protein n=2 Tax=Rhizopus TaxID=4842 RepID=A0A1X0SGS1_RHIZD|nr:hypothetical protein BCV71DRAFT_170085 [Rhizopus microsporus]
MSISPASRDVVLAGRQGLVIIDLEDPWLIPRIVPHMSKWEVADVQWSPHMARESWIASTSNQKLLVWNLNYTGSRAIEHVFHAHVRAISDINWSLHHPDILATCSVDTYVHLWDLREPLKDQEEDADTHIRPSHSFTPWNAAATQVKFNRKNEYLIASAHDKDVKIWDIRKGALPVTSITAHSKKIYGIDWSRQNDHDIFWDINHPTTEQETIVTDTPIWRARNTPFGNGVLIMPQGNDSKLTLYNRASPEVPVHAFEGHQDTVKEFVWRWKGDMNGPDGDDREFQLVTWSKDQNLRLWPVSPEVMKSVGHEPSRIKTKLSAPSIAFGDKKSTRTFRQEPDESKDMKTRSIAGAAATRLTSMTPFRSVAQHSTAEQNYKEQKYSAINPLLWMQNVKTVGPTGEIRRDAAAEHSYQSVADEMSTVLNKYLPVGVKTEKINAASRTCTISLHGPWSDTGDALLRITIRFSPQYPDNSPPEFDIHKNSMISIYYRAHMTQDLIALASNYTSQKKWCLEPCIRYLLGENVQESEYGIDHHSIDSATNNNNASPGHWKGAAIDIGDSDDELGQGWDAMGDDFRFGKRVSMTSERGVMVDMSTKQSTDEKVPFPRLCGGVFSGSGQLICFFSTLRVRDTNRSGNSNTKNENNLQQDNQSHQSGRSNSEYFENTYSDFYRHPRTYEQFEEYKEIAAMSRQGKNATVLVGGTGGAFGEYTYDDEQDDMDDDLNTVNSSSLMHYNTGSMAMNGALDSSDSLLYHGSKADRISHTVMIVDFSDKMPYSPWLAKEYILSSKDPVGSCIHNAKVCQKHGRLDLYKIWYLAVEILRDCVPEDLAEPERLMQEGPQSLSDDKKNKLIFIDDDTGQEMKLPEIRAKYDHEPLDSLVAAISTTMKRVKWGMHPFGQKLVYNLIQHFIQIGDIQTAAMLSCIFQLSASKPSTATIFTHKPSLHSERSPESVELDYFSLKTSHKNPFDFRANSGPNSEVAEKIYIAPFSSSYGNKTSTFLSFLLETENRRLSPTIDRITDTPNDIAMPKRTSSTRLSKSRTTTTASYTKKLKIPSNTAPGARHTLSQSLGSHYSSASSAPATPLQDKEGKLLPSSATAELKLEYSNLEQFDGEKFFDSFNQIPLVDNKSMAQLDVLRLGYADMLYRWNLLELRAEILKFLHHQPFPADYELASQSVQVSCHSCGIEVSNHDKYCHQCRKIRKVVRCSYCHVMVKGLINFCIHCGHGGHTYHMEDWFVTNQQMYCMTGCGCKCALDAFELRA